ncbi:MAG: sulfotransferase [Candidatus Gracilibacteria bacterium]|nr:sulfotransferase [Candidatus Gracilibacteria bacterium]
MNKPNLFIVGAPKCGTTSMHYYLSQHPEIFMSEDKEPYFFCSDIIEEAKKFNNNHSNLNQFKYKNLDEYLTIFNTKKTYKYYGESTVLNLYSKKAAKNIYNFNKDSKIIIMLREPVDFIYSLHSQFLHSYYEDELSFTKALELEKERKKWISLPKNINSPSILYYSEILKFSEQINRYLKLFPIENIKVILFNDLKNDTKAVYKNILKFLEVNNKNFLPEFSIQNPKTKVIFPKIKKILEFPILWKIPKIILPNKVYNKIKNFINSKITIVKKYELDEKFKKELMKKYKNEVVELNNILHENNLINKNIDLVTLWGYNKI